MLNKKIYFYVLSYFYFFSLTASWKPLQTQNERAIIRQLENSYKSSDSRAVLRAEQILLTHPSSDTRNSKELETELSNRLFKGYMAGDIITRQYCVAFILPQDQKSCCGKLIHNCYQTHRNVELCCLNTGCGFDVADNSIKRALLCIDCFK